MFSSPPPRFRVYVMGDAAQAQAQRLGLSDAEVVAMARQAAPCTNPLGNWRYDSFVLRIEQGIITAIGRMSKKKREAAFRGNSVKGQGGGGNSFAILRTPS